MCGMSKKKKLKSNLITYGMVIAAFVIIQILQSTGHLSSLLQGLLVPICVYVILAVSLNLVVGISGELSLGHACFMCVGAFTGAFFTKCMQEVITVDLLRFVLAILVAALAAALFGILIGIPVLRRLSRDCDTRVRRDYQEFVQRLLYWQGLKRIPLFHEGSVFSRYGGGRQDDSRRSAGHHRHRKAVYIFDRRHSGSDHAVYCAEPDRLARREGDHVDP